MSKTHETLILGIETSCDETALSLVKARGGLSNPTFKVVRSLVASQINIHRPFGGVVPTLAKREHMKNLPILYRQICGKSQGANRKLLHSTFHVLHSIDLIAVTVGPGLEPALWTGIEFAKTLERAYGIPVVGANHLEGHLYSFLLGQDARYVVRGARTIFPAVALIVSGGHTILLSVQNLAHWRRLGETRDDAAGEAFDKVARLLYLPYPGGPEIEKIAREGNPETAVFPRPMIHDKNYDFSFSGLKTAVLYYLREVANRKSQIADGVPFGLKTQQKANVAASFQTAVIDVLTAKTMRAAMATNARTVILCGGVAANTALRKALGKAAKAVGLQFLVPSLEHNTDNASMIAAAGYLAMLRKKRYPLRANGNLDI